MEDRSGREVRVVRLMYKGRETGVRCEGGGGITSGIGF